MAKRGKKIDPVLSKYLFLNRHLHIVCLDAPYPPDYGGAMEMFGKIKALYQEGIKIHLHYFDFKSKRNMKELTHYCEIIHSYPRKLGWKGFSFTIPYIFSSRKNDELVSRLNKDNYPILLEGIHCTGIINLINKEKRRILIRLHNDENIYYKNLARYEINPFKKLYFLNESRLLKKYQLKLPRGCLYACLSQKDTDTFVEKYKLPAVEFLPAFLCWSQVNCEEGTGNFCLYHGNLSVAENEKAACWLLADPSEKEINDLVQKAHINILPSFNKTGIKLKLLHALYRGRHCVVNPAAVEGLELNATCHIGNTASAIASIILQLYHQPFGEEEIRLRKKILGEIYNNKNQAQKIIAWLY